MTRILALCADDFGASAAIDRSILSLVRQGRLSEVSCLVNGPRWMTDAKTLAALPAVKQRRVRIGLHFCLTEGRPLSPALQRAWPTLPTLAALLVRSHLGGPFGLLPTPALRDELQAQFDAFEFAAGRQPDHLDGHQHVHHLPGVRRLVLDLLARWPRLRARHTGAVRGPGFTAKQRIIEGTGGSALGRRLLATGQAANTQLLGVYDFIDSDYRSLMQGWLAALPARGGLVFCHPGERDDSAASAASAADPIAAARVRELAYLGSDAFAEDMAAADVRLASKPLLG